MNSVNTISICRLLALAAFLAITLMTLQPAVAAEYGPQVITEEMTCGKCGMYPARYPQWQSQIIFTDGSMAPFDGCKCMFGFMHNMGQYDAGHTMDDIAEIWVRDFKTGEWLDAGTAHFVVGSDVMGPMGKELIPFQDQAAAALFQKEHGGDLAAFDMITMETLKPLMGNMHMGGKVKMEGQKMNGHMNK
jgi:nitrous oxide reductase accessory protein NosL